MRIISGTYGGRTITPPRNLRARPTTDFAKENLFNVLGNIIDFEGLDVLDLFAGTGSISYEFASRGAKSVTAVEVNAVHHNFIKDTAVKFGMRNLFATRANAFLYLKNTRNSFDVVFSDAPYDLREAPEIVDLALGGNILRPGGLLVFEHSGATDFSSHPQFKQARNYGSVHFAIFGK